MAPDSRRLAGQFLSLIRPKPRDLGRSQPIELLPSLTRPNGLTVIAWPYPQQVCAEEASLAGPRGRCRELVLGPRIRSGIETSMASCPTACLGPLFFHALKNEGSAVSGQNTLNLGHLSAFELLDMCGEYLGTALFGSWIGRPDHPHLDW